MRITRVRSKGDRPRRALETLPKFKDYTRHELFLKVPRTYISMYVSTYVRKKCAFSHKFLGVVYICICQRVCVIYFDGCEWEV